MRLCLLIVGEWNSQELAEGEMLQRDVWGSARRTYGPQYGGKGKPSPLPFSGGKKVGGTTGYVGGWELGEWRIFGQGSKRAGTCLIKLFAHGKDKKTMKRCRGGGVFFPKKKNTKRTLGKGAIPLRV